MKTASKKTLRDYYLKKRRALAKTEKIRKSKNIFKKIFEIVEPTRLKNIFIYLAVDNEVDTKQVIDVCLAKNINVFVPAHLKKTNNYFISGFTNWLELENGPNKIPQPINIKRINPSSIEIAVIPGIAFSKTGVRLGYGKGVFDKLLTGSNALKIGLAYDFQITDELPKEKHDLKMDIIVTEKRIIRT